MPGFYNLLEAIGDPKHEEHEAMRDWLGGGFDPETFLIHEVNRRLAPLQRRQRSHSPLAVDTTPATTPE